MFNTGEYSCHMISSFESGLVVVVNKMVDVYKFIVNPCHLMKLAFLDDIHSQACVMHLSCSCYALFLLQ